MAWGDTNLQKVLKNNGVAVMPTDTIYGIVGLAQSEFVVNRIYELRKRAPSKPCIILVGDESELEKFSIILSEKQKTAIKKYWPGPVSIVLDCPDEELEYLHRGTKTLAFRVPASAGLQALLKETGPLIAPSANLEARPPSETIAEAKKYFGDKVDLYVDGGTIKGSPSKVIKLSKDGSVEILRY
ncbi:threonylcarbamoyl-AMP synthase [Candidatus Nomurabacteria bacterium RIFCSPLOWO2_01_FULL_40_18]|uniref:L-threonylcarbamoyladenylate synthase n=1 Tax=Candidatus Nomurabacteria bacterium RIFCSPLOWO2_01_FULL_40_18 TaxID=1801773 RepID=A0A1F6XLF0_9BACT|nr:MAG: threonylcarbamoyl-AMP synthase [Candidatus Nomurabacteria bacterium RIFCSPLOWO2_01_FULL_40_18]